MTIEKMPDVIWAYNDGYTVEITCPPTEHDIFPHAKYLRAEPVKELLEHVRDQIEFCKKHDHTPALDKSMMLIDKFLGDK